jgi:hypothetical protein
MRRVLPVLVLCLSGSALAQPVDPGAPAVLPSAPTPDDPIARGAREAERDRQLRAAMDQLARNTAELEHLKAAQAKAATEARAWEISGKPGKGVTFEHGDLFSLTVRGRFMLRYTFGEHDGARTQELTVRRARLYIQGHTFSRKIQYYFHLAAAPQDFEPDSHNPIYDTYLQLTHLRDLQIRVGQQLTPFNRSRVISSQNAELIDRSIVNAELNLDRDLGLKLSSTDLGGLGGRLSYEAFVGMGNGRNQLTGNMGLLYMLRLQVNPMGKFDDYVEADVERVTKPRLSIGAAIAFNHDAVRHRSTIDTFYKLGSFDYLHGTADVMFKWAGFGLQAEWIARWSITDSHTGIDPATAMSATPLTLTEYSRRAHGYFVQAGYVFPLGIGVAARWSQLFDLGGGTHDPALVKTITEQGKELIGGLSYYFRGHVLKVQADYAYLFGTDVGAGRHQVRLQAHVGY